MEIFANRWKNWNIYFRPNTKTRKSSKNPSLITESVVSLVMHFRGLTQAIQHAPNVTSLDLSHSQLDKVPAMLWQMFPALRQLNLSHNQLRTIPKRLSKLVHLERLQLDHNRITHIPDNFEQLEGLRQLSLKGNKLRSLSALPTRLEVVDLSHNRFRSVPATLLQCQHLLHLDLRNNQLAALPSTLANVWPQLQYLQVSSNRLTNLPPLPQRLYALQAERNQIIALPDNWQKLQKLSRLGLADNPIKIQAADITKLGALTWVDVYRTPTSWGQITTLLSNIPKLTHSKGGLNKSAQKRLDAFLQYASLCPEEVSLLNYYLLTQGKHTGLIASQLLTCLSPEQPPLVAAQAHRILCQIQRLTKRQLLKLPWRIIGETQLNTTLIKRRLQAKGYALASDTATEAIGVLGTTVGELVEHYPAFLISERALLHRLDAQEGRYLTSGEIRPEHVQAEQYLTSGKSSQFRLGVGLLRAFGTPDILLPSLWRLYRSQAPLPNSDWSDVLLPYLPIFFQRLATGTAPTEKPKFYTKLERLLWAANNTLRPKDSRK